MGTNKKIKTTKHTKDTKTGGGVGSEPWKGIFSGNGVIVSGKSRAEAIRVHTQLVSPAEGAERP